MFSTSDVVALIGAFVGAGALIFATRMKISFSTIKDSLENVKNSLSIDIERYTKQNEEDHRIIAENVVEIKKTHEKSIDILLRDNNEIKKRLDRQDGAREMSVKYRKQLLDIRNSHIVYFEQDSCLKQLAMEKCALFLNFVMDIHAIGFYREDEEGNTFPNIDYKIIEETCLSSAETIKTKGYALLGKEFTEVFYGMHYETTDNYLKEVKSIVHDKSNFKHERFQEASCMFQREFLQMLHKCYIINSRLLKKEEELCKM